MTVRKFLGWLLMILGGLVSVLTGGCSILFLINTPLPNPPSGHVAIFVGFVDVLLVGGIPFAIGLALFFIGKKLTQPKEKGQT